MINRESLFKKSRNRKKSTNKLVVELFWERVQKTESCWNWTGVTDGHGYGKIKVDGKYHSAYRVAWTIVNGDIPEGLNVAHSCDNPKCVRPEHLFLATHQENTQDAVKKRRIAWGVRHGNSKLTEEQVRIIRDVPEGYSYKRIAKAFGVSWYAIYAIRKNRAWKYLE